jgi:hypothetical protein
MNYKLRLINCARLATLYNDVIRKEGLNACSAQNLRLDWVGFRKEYQSYKCDIHRLYKNYYMNENIL